jgi:hypothetical protein
MLSETELFEKIACAIVTGDRDEALTHLREMAVRRDGGGWPRSSNFLEAVERGRTCRRARQSQGVTA